MTDMVVNNYQIAVTLHGIESISSCYNLTRDLTTSRNQIAFTEKSGLATRDKRAY